MKASDFILQINAGEKASKEFEEIKEFLKDFGIFDDVLSVIEAQKDIEKTNELQKNAESENFYCITHNK
jgi:hypothetical protein